MNWLLSVALKWALGLLVTWVMFGRMDGEEIALILLFFCALRTFRLIRPPPPGATQLESSLRPPPFSLRIAEFFGLVTFLLLAPLDLALGTHSFFALRIYHGWMSAVALLVCIGFYALPHFRNISGRFPSAASIWWFSPFFPAVSVLVFLLTFKHPYLNPLHPERNRLAAEKVLALESNITAAHYADWVLRYARELDGRSDPNAAHFYRVALELDSNLSVARTRLQTLDPTVPLAGPVGASREFYWSTNRPVAKAPRLQKAPESCAELTVLVVPVGDVPEILLDVVAHTIHYELALPTFVITDAMKAPAPVVGPGLLKQKQLMDDDILRDLTKVYPYNPDRLIRYIAVAVEDIKMQGSAYSFSVHSQNYGAIVSSYRMVGSGAPVEWIAHRTAKQALSAFIKCLGVPPSHERECVTSYTRSLEELDIKGNRPTPATMELFKKEVSMLHAREQLRKALNP